MSTKTVSPELDIHVNAADVDARAWDEYVRGHEFGSCFHLTSWQSAIEASFGYRPYNVVADEGGKIRGVLPLYRVRNLPFGCSLVSSPMAVYGGICADDAEVAAALRDRAEVIARDLGVRYLELRNEQAVDGLPVKDLYYTFKREITRDEDADMAAIPRNQRRSIRVGKKNELEARVERDAFLDDFYELYSQSVHHHGSPVYPKHFFANLLSAYGDDCIILGVFKDGEMLAAVLTFLFRGQVLPYYAGANRDAFKLAVYDFMYWSLMCHGRENGCDTFDFGRSKKGTGSFDFKRHWGFEPTPLPYQYYLVKQREIPDVNPSNPKLSLPIRVWRKLPLRVTQWLGPKVVKYFP